MEEVDVDDYDAAQRHADRVLAAAGRINISFNAAGMDDVQGTPLHEMQLENFMLPITQAARRHFNTTTAAAKRMISQGQGVIVLLTSSAAREWRHKMGGFSLPAHRLKLSTETLAGELAGTGVRTVCIRANFTPETAPGRAAGSARATSRRHVGAATALSVGSRSVRSTVYREYLQLAHTTDGWKIVNALWRRTVPE